MSKLEKAWHRIASKPKDYTYSEARWLLTKLGFVEDNKGKTSGSRVKFYRKSDNRLILLHKPHPGDVMKRKMTIDLFEYLCKIGAMKNGEK